jgi:pilus assembly protein TadC
MAMRYAKQCAVVSLIVLCVVAAVDARAAHVDLGEETGKQAKQIWERIIYAYRALDHWLYAKIGFNFSKLFDIVRAVLVWILELFIKIFQWIIALIR